MERCFTNCYRKGRDVCMGSCSLRFSPHSLHYNDSCLHAGGVLCKMRYFHSCKENRNGSASFGACLKYEI